MVRQLCYAGEMGLVSAIELLSGTHQTLGCETQLCVHVVLAGASSLRGPGLALPAVAAVPSNPQVTHQCR